MISRTLAIAFVVSVIGGVFLDTSGAFVVVTSGVVVVAIRISLALKVIFHYSRGDSLHEAEKLPPRGFKNRYLLDDMGLPEVASFGLGPGPCPAEFCAGLCPQVYNGGVEPSRGGCQQSVAYRVGDARRVAICRGVL